jgi:hypothetical protein
MAKQSIPSMELERSMNLMCHVMTIEEALRNSEVIDSLDDKRRDEQWEIQDYLFELRVKHVEGLYEFAKELPADYQAKLVKLASDFNKKFHQYFQKYRSLKKEEKKLEEIDDKNRNYLINYVKECREKLGDENSKIEAEIIAKRITND